MPTNADKALQEGREQLAQQIELAKAWFDKLPIRDVQTMHMLYHQPMDVIMKVMLGDAEIARIMLNLSHISFGLLASGWVEAHDRAKAEKDVEAQKVEDKSGSN